MVGKRFDSKAIGNAKMAKAANAATGNKTAGIARYLQGPIGDALDDVFASLSGYLGKTEDLATQLPGSGIAPWAPLTVAYQKRKGHARYFILLAARGQHRHRRRTAHDVLHGTGPTLLETLQRMKGRAVFGGLSVRSSIGARLKLEAPEAVSLYSHRDRPRPNLMGCISI